MRGRSSRAAVHLGQGAGQAQWVVEVPAALRDAVKPDEAFVCARTVMWRLGALTLRRGRD